jgi:salicylate hydroxylase
MTCYALQHVLACPTYTKGKIVLLGDAAHASTPYQGAGLGQGIEDAMVICELLGNLSSSSYSSIVNAFKAYDQVRRVRAQKLARTSYEAGLLYSFMGPEGDDIEAVKKNIETRMNWLWYESMEGEIKRALQKFEELESVGHVLDKDNIEVKEVESVDQDLGKEIIKSE